MTMPNERVSANSEAMPITRKKYHAFKLPDLLEGISLVLSETSNETWQTDVAIAIAIADVGAEYAHNVVDELDRVDALAAIRSNAAQSCG